MTKCKLKTKIHRLTNYSYSISIVISLLTVQAFAGTTGKISGKVTNKSTGELLTGTNILLEGTSLGAASGLEGNYNILNLSPGIYSIKATMIGFKSLTVKNIQVRVDLTTRIDIELEESTILGEEVSVIAERPRVRLDITSSQSLVSAEEIEAMPVEEVEEIISLKAGVVRGTGGEIHIRGGRSGEIVYMIDGVPVNDNYNSSLGVEIENSAIAELQVISGTFNAEYGQAQSGIINIITKDGSPRFYRGQIEYYVGDYYTQNSELFINNDRFELSGIKDLQANLSGPILKDKLSFFAFVRFKDDEGFLFGKRLFETDSYNYEDLTGKLVPTTIIYDTTEIISDTLFIVDTTIVLGDGAIVPMNPSTQLSGEFKLTYQLNPKIKIRFGGRGSDTEFKSYSHKFRYNPDGDYTYFRRNSNYLLGWDQSLSNNSFFTLRYSRLYNESKNYYHNDSENSDIYNTDPRVFNPLRGTYFYVSGMRMGNFKRYTKSNLLKGDFVSQLNNNHKIRAGFIFSRDEVYLRSFSIQYNRNTNFTPVIPSPDTPGYENSISYTEYNHTPSLIGFYVQDKMEYLDIVLNVGLRYERFYPDGITPADFRDTFIDDPLTPAYRAMTREERMAFWYNEASVKAQWSPRIGVAHKISDKGSIHFSYGHFLQIPSYVYLYANPRFIIASGASSIIGNADLNPEKTVQYEVGLQQELTTDLTLEAVGFYKDVRGLLDTEIRENLLGDNYARYINRDYSNVRGFTLTLTKLASRGVYTTFDYTYSVAEGNASDPTTAFFDFLGGRDPEKQLVFLNWDQTHTLNIVTGYKSSPDFGITLLGSYGSGLPYTPSLSREITAFENSGRRPSQYKMDIRAFWGREIGGLKTTFIMNIYNLFNRKNERLVYSDTGRANYTFPITSSPPTYAVNTREEYIIRPDFYASPRSFKIGVRLTF